MKIIREWEWDYRSLRIGHQWRLEKDEEIEFFKFELFGFQIMTNLIAIVVFNFIICYQWD